MGTHLKAMKHQLPYHTQRYLPPHHIYYVPV